MADWRRVNGVILYSTLFGGLGDDAVVRLAGRAIERPDAYLTTDDIYQGIGEALRSGTVLSTQIPGTHSQPPYSQPPHSQPAHSQPPHSEPEYREFLLRLRRRLDVLRPWPEPPFRVVDPSGWHDLGYLPPAARIRLSVIKVQERLRHPFGQAEGDGHEVMALRLASGTEVALVTGRWPGGRDVALLARDPAQAPAQVTAEFRAATGLAEHEVIVLPA